MLSFFHLRLPFIFLSRRSCMEYCRNIFADTPNYYLDMLDTVSYRKEDVSTMNRFLDTYFIVGMSLTLVFSLKFSGIYRWIYRWWRPVGGLTIILPNVGVQLHSKKILPRMFPLSFGNSRKSFCRAPQTGFFCTEESPISNEPTFYETSPSFDKISQSLMSGVTFVVNS